MSKQNEWKNERRMKIIYGGENGTCGEFFFFKLEI